MPDFLTAAERSARMAAIRSRDTSPELALRKALHAMGLRYRVNDRRLPGKPDIVLPRHRAVVFVHGCFWNRHEGCRVASTPKSNTGFWLEKFRRNVERDARAVRDLKALGWRVFVTWECSLGSKRKVADVAVALNRLIRTDAGGPLGEGMQESLWR